MTPTVVVGGRSPKAALPGTPARLAYSSTPALSRGDAPPTPEVSQLCQAVGCGVRTFLESPKARSGTASRENLLQARVCRRCGRPREGKLGSW